MLKIILANAAVGGIVLLTGVAIYEMTDMRTLGDRMAAVGFAYVILSLTALAIPLYQRAFKRHVQAWHAKRLRTAAYDDLLRYKTLLDQEIISKEEFDAKTRELKAKVL